MKFYLVSAAILLLSNNFCLAQVRVSHLLCDDRPEPIGLGDPHPRFSWRLEAPGSAKDIYQSAYEMRVSGRKLSWSSGKVNSAQSVHVAYGGPALGSGRRYEWQVRVWDSGGRPSAWSARSFWQMGLLQPEDWTAAWISAGFVEDSVNRPSPILQRYFSVKGRPVRATLYITAHGLYEARLNGQPVTDARFTPGYTEYDHRFQYQAYDVTDLIHAGGNQTEVTLGDGWYRGIFGPWNNPNNYGKDASLLYELIISYRNGLADTIISDGSWQSATGPIRYADLYNGEIDDARIDPANWTSVKVEDFPKDNLVATLVEPVREHETFAPVAILTSPRGEKIIDFGQNLSGWVRFKVRGNRGDTIRLAHAETLDQDGNFYTGNLREAKAEDIFVLRGGGEEEFAPHFTFHGFRYVKIEGYPGEMRPEDFRSVAIYSSLPVTGHFHCSDSLINRLQQNTVWSQQSNFLDIPTDCPQRSERLGWTGDAELFAPTAAFNKRVDGFMEKWLQDLRLAQGLDGGMPEVVPDIRNRTVKRAPHGYAGWGDAAVIIPWTLFQIYGDTARLAESYASMQAWSGYVHAHAPTGLWRNGGYGDWLAPDPYQEKGRDSVYAAQTDLSYISQCFYFYSTSLLAKAAGVLGRQQDSLAYVALADTIRRAYLSEYLTPGARAISNTQTAYVLALYTGIIPEPLAKEAAARLVQLIHNNHDHLGTGFLGTPFLCPVLTKYGYTDLAYTLLEQTTPPSWLYPVQMGATTIWENWLTILPSRRVQEFSLNHYAYGAIGNWLYRDVAGINPGAPGYQRVIIHPHVGGHLTEVDASYDSDYGTIRSHWKLSGGQLTLEVEIPANTRAEIWLPEKAGEKVVEVGSGKYTFNIP